MMKKGTILFLILTLILGSFSVVSAATGAEQVMSNFNIMPVTCSADSDNLVTRRDFAYTIANILGCGKMDPRDTEYVDITADLEDSGYIYFATVNGFLIPDGNLFCPDDPISFYDFNAAVVKLLAYETVALSNGGGDAGNMKTVMDLYLYNGVKADNYDVVTVKQYRQLVYNLLTASVSDFSYSYDEAGNVNLERTGGTKTILSEYFGISRYYGSIVEVNNSKPSAKVYITKNVSNVNPTWLAVNQTYTFLSNGKVDLNFYKNIPVEIWADKDGMMVYIAPQANVEVFYDVIYSVNNDTNVTNAYAMNLVSEMEFNRDDKEYKIASGCQVSYNGEVVNYPVPLAGKYAKIVLIDNKVTFIETWNLQEGGVVTEVNNSYIEYKKGHAIGRVKRISEYENIQVIIEGYSTDRDQIKPGSLFYYYQDSDLLVVAISEKTIVGTLESLGNDELEIGRHFYPIRDDDNDGIGDVYYSEDGENFAVNDYERVFGKRVICYVDIFGDIRYIVADGSLNSDNTFTGYLMGYSKKGFDDFKLKIKKIYPSVEEIIVTLPSDLNDYNVLGGAVYATESDLRNMFRDKTALETTTMKVSNLTDAYKKIFKFKVNDENEIVSISEADYFKMFGDAHTAQTVTVDADGNRTYTDYSINPGYSYDMFGLGFDGSERSIFMYNFQQAASGIYNNITNVRDTAGYYWVRGEKYVALYEENGNVEARILSYETIRTYGAWEDVNLEEVRYAFIGEQGVSAPEFCLLYGNLDMFHVYKGTDKTAYIDSITQKYDMATDQSYYEVRMGTGETVWKFDSIEVGGGKSIDGVTSITDGNGATELAPGMKLTYNEGVMFNANGIYLTAAQAYPAKANGEEMTMEDFLYKNMPTSLTGTIDKITDHRLFLLDSSGVHPSYAVGKELNIIGVKFENGKAIEEEVTAAEVPSGTTIYFNSTYNVEVIYFEMVD